MRTKISPPALAKLWGIGSGKVLDFIRSGELRAIDVSSRRALRPRYLIDLADIAAFEAARAVVPPPKVARRRRQLSADVIQFF